MNLPRLCLLVLTAAVLTGCAVGPNYHTPDERPPADFAAVHGGSSMTSKPPSHAPQAATVRLRNLVALPERPRVGFAGQSALVEANPDAQIALDRPASRADLRDLDYRRGRFRPSKPAPPRGKGTGSDLTRGRASNTLYSADNSSGLQHINEIGGFDGRMAARCNSASTAGRSRRPAPMHNRFSPNVTRFSSQ